MAIKRNAAQQDSWQPKAEQFAVIHTMPAPAQVRQRPLLKRVTCQFRSLGAKFKHRPETSKVELENELGQTRASLVKLEKQAARAPTAAEALDHVKTRVAHVTAADMRVAELRNEIGSAREELVRLENENTSLRTSHNLITGENARLCYSLTESDLAVDKARSQLEQKQAALTVADAECNKLVSTVDEKRDMHSTGTTAPNTPLETVSSGAVAEVEAWLSLLARAEGEKGAKRKAADAPVVRNAADQKLALVQNSLEVKKRQFQRLERSYSKLVEGMHTLLKIFKMRETALTHAEERIEFLAERVAQLEAEAHLVKSQSAIDKPNSQRECTVAGVTRDRPRTNWPELLQELDNYVRNNSRHSERIRASASETLLADTIAF